MSEYRETYERSKKRQLTVTLEAGLAKWVRETAAEHGVPISTVFEVALRNDMERRRKVSA